MPRPSPVRSVLVAAVFAALAAWAPAQDRRPLTHDDYDQWKSLRGTAYSPDGSWVAFQLEPQFGDGLLEVRQVDGETVHRHPLASGARFSPDGRLVAFTVGKSKVEERQKKIDDLRKKAAQKNQPKTEGEKKEGEEPATTPTEPEPTPEPGAEPGGPGGRFAGARGGAPGGRRGGAGGRPGMGGADGNAPSRERGELAVLDLATGKLEKIGKVKGFAMPEDANVLIYHLEAPEPAKPEAGKPEAGKLAGEGEKPAEKAPEAAAAPTQPKAGEEKPAEAKVQTGEPAQAAPATGEARPEGGRRGGRRGNFGGPGGGAGRGNAAPEDPLARKRQDGTVLVIRDLGTGQERRIEDVAAYGTSRKAKWLWYQTCSKKPDPKKHYGLFVLPLAGGDPIQLLDGAVGITGVTIDRAEQALAFLSDKEDFAADKPKSDLYLWDGSAQPAMRIVHSGTNGMPAGRLVGGSPSFARDGSVIEFDVRPAPEPELPEILPDEKVALDLWHWNDGQLQTQQARGGRGGGGGGRNETWTAVWHRAEGRLLVVGDDMLPQVRFLNRDGSRGLASDSKPYEKLTTWDGRYADVWLVNTVDGTRSKVLDKLRGNVTNSPGGRYLVWFGADYHWWTYDVATGQKRDLTGGLAVPFHRGDDDHPEPDPAHGLAGWTEGDEAVLLYDEFDLWKISPKTGDAVCVTDGLGRASRTRLRIQPLPRVDDSEYTPEQLVLAATNLDTMAEGFFVDTLSQPEKPKRLTMLDKSFGELTKAKKADRWFFTISTFEQFPDLWTAPRDFSAMKRLSDANPQQKDYRWGKAELVSWISGDGERLKGILVKPDGFDPTRKYPMLVHFYERSSQNLHNYVAPAPGTSPNAAYYVSNGYLWFMPDIVYREGYPGESCVKCVVAGVQHLIAQGFVDEKAIGAAGHSWGGYQTAFLVTRTNIFAAVESGAPVSNMISAYGGIRYESGVSRQFQYEMTQSRIGGTPWQFPMRFWENSPIFFADKVQTPVLILHNDQDGAVPWTNGIEYFTALRRLGKEAYLFNYNGEGHGLGKRPNQKDWARRMAEYFGHHLKGEPAPQWMREGVPYGERDREKLPFTPSYIEAYVKAAPVPPVEAPARAAEAKPAEAAVPAGNQDVGQEGQKKPAAVPEKPGPAEAKPAATPQNGTPKAKEAERPMLEPGKDAPDFAIADEAGKVHTLADYRGKTLVLWFYPKADTPG